MAVKMDETIFAGYLRRWRYGGLLIEFQMDAIQSAVRKFSVRSNTPSQIVVVFVENELKRWEWRGCDRPALQNAFEFCKKNSARLVTLPWGGRYSDPALNEKLGIWNEKNYGRLLTGMQVAALGRKTPKKGKKIKPRRSPAIGDMHGFASPLRADTSESREKGLRRQEEIRECYYREIEQAAVQAISMGFDTPSKLQGYLDALGIKTMRGKSWSRQSASNLLKRLAQQQP